VAYTQPLTLPGQALREDHHTPRIVTFLLLLAIAVYFCCEYPLGERSGATQVGQYTIILMSAVGATSCVGRDRPRLGSLVFWLFTFAVIGIVQTVQLSAAENPFGVNVPDSYVERQQIIVLAGCLAYLVGSVATSRPTGETATVTARRNLSVRRTLLWSMVTLVGSVYSVSAYGGVSALFASRAEVAGHLASVGDTTASRALLVGFASGAPFMCLFGLLRLRSSGALRLSSRPLALAVFSGLLVVNVLINNPISQPRYWVATILITFVASGRWISRPAFQVGLVAGFLLTALVFFPFLDAFRYQDGGGWSGGFESAYLAKTDYGSAQDITNTVFYVDHHGHTDGRQLLGAALFPVPRAVWPSKPTDTAVLLANEINFGNQNIDSPLWAEGYIDFGIPGTIALLGLFGAVIGRAETTFAALERRCSMSSILVPTLIGYELILLRGSLLQATARLAVIVAMAYLLSRRAGADTSQV
jgi:oligosaccharide repeat unit polymerase